MKKSLFILSGVLLILLAACDDEFGQPQLLLYDQMLFVRMGGGSKTFSVFPAGTVEGYEIRVSHLNFRDTSITMIISKDTSNTALFITLARALRGQCQLTGNFQQLTAATGTWASLFLVKDNTQTEITNTGLRDSLLSFERIVENNL